MMVLSWKDRDQQFGPTLVDFGAVANMLQYGMWVLTVQNHATVAIYNTMCVENCLVGKQNVLQIIINLQ
jgi:hypothetical protein